VTDAEAPPAQSYAAADRTLRTFINRLRQNQADVSRLRAFIARRNQRGLLTLNSIRKSQRRFPSGHVQT
jgi:hypothetical protein